MRVDLWVDGGEGGWASGHLGTGGERMCLGWDREWRRGWRIMWLGLHQCLDMSYSNAGSLASITFRSMSTWPGVANEWGGRCVMGVA